MNRRILSAITAFVGLVVIALAVCSATVWRPSSTAQATLAQTPDQNYVVTEPGVLGLVDSAVTITATASDDEPVVLVVGHSSDVRAWLADDPYVSVTGLSDWDALTSESVTTSCPSDGAATSAPASATAGAAASAAPSATATTDAKGCTVLTTTGADPTASDMWIATKSGTNEVSLQMDATDPDLVVLAATDGAGSAPSLSLSWPRHVSTPWLVPGLVLGGLLLLVGVFQLLVDFLTRREDERRRAAAAERAARIASADSTSTAGIPTVGDPDRALTRREKRDKERAEKDGGEWIDPRTGRVYLGGVEAPAVPQAPVLQQVESITDEEARAAVGAAMGSSVVPGLDEAVTEAHRGTRGLEDVSPLVVEPVAAEAPAESAEEAEKDLARAETATLSPVSQDAETTSVVPDGAADEGADADAEGPDGQTAEASETTDVTDDEENV